MKKLIQKTRITVLAALPFFLASCMGGSGQFTDATAEKTLSCNGIFLFFRLGLNENNLLPESKIIFFSGEMIRHSSGNTPGNCRKECFCTPVFSR
ncbi:MAG: hypothetical protein IKA79_07685 [Lentisphaeria bacterium]|nr:hypothetical protein [Lentisphaeria bacterium]